MAKKSKGAKKNTPSKKTISKKAVAKKPAIKKTVAKKAVAKKAAVLKAKEFRPICITESKKLGSWTASKQEAIDIAKTHEDATTHVTDIEERE